MHNGAIALLTSAKMQMAVSKLLWNKLVYRHIERKTCGICICISS